MHADHPGSRALRPDERLPDEPASLQHDTPAVHPGSPRVPYDVHLDLLPLRDDLLPLPAGRQQRDDHAAQLRPELQEGLPTRHPHGPGRHAHRLRLLPDSHDRCQEPARQALRGAFRPELDKRRIRRHGQRGRWQLPRQRSLLRRGQGPALHRHHGQLGRGGQGQRAP